MPRTLATAALLAAAALIAATTGRPEPAEAAAEAIARTLDDFHDAASDAEYDRYFAHFADKSVFLGTDATERWTLDEFRAFAKPHFDRGTGWTYTVIERHVTVGEHERTAWFDERLSNKGLGECRGSGVLVRDGARWRVAQYNLTIPIPNDLADQVAAMIREHQH